MMEMNEQAITEGLARSAPPTDHAFADSPGGSGRGVMEDPNYTRLYNWFNVGDSPDPKTERMVQKIYEYAKNQSRDGEWHNVLWAVRSLETKLGAPSLGETRHNKLYGYVMLMGDRNRIEQELQAYESPTNGQHPE